MKRIQCDGKQNYSLPTLVFVPEEDNQAMKPTLIEDTNVLKCTLMVLTPDCGCFCKTSSAIVVGRLRYSFVFDDYMYVIVAPTTHPSGSRKFAR